MIQEQEIEVEVIPEVLKAIEEFFEKEYGEKKEEDEIPF